MKLLKKVARSIKSGLLLIASPIFCLFSSIVIHASKLDKVDSWPSQEEIEKQNAWAKELKEKYPSSCETR